MKWSCKCLKRWNGLCECLKRYDKVSAHDYKGMKLSLQMSEYGMVLEDVWQKYEPMYVNVGQDMKWWLWMSEYWIASVNVWKDIKFCLNYIVIKSILTKF